MELRKACESGTIICGECKSRVIERLTKFLKEHQAKRKRVLAKVEKLVGDL